MILAGFLGCGNMGGALAAAAAKQVGGDHILTADHNPEKLERLRRVWGTVPVSAAELAARSPMLFLGVKPQGLQKTAEELRDVLAARQDRFVLVTMAAGVPLAAVSELLGGCPVIRIMPNTPASVGAGAIPYCCGPGVTQQDEADFRTLLGGAGLLLPMPEGKIDAACALSGCGPAFVCMFLEALADGGVFCGLTRQEAELLAVQTLAGTAKLAAETGTDPAALRSAVCSPGGSTIAGVRALEQRALRGAVMDAVAAAWQRTLELKAGS